MDELGIVSGPTANNNSNKKDTILERLSKRNKDRQNYLETKLELRNKEHTESEGADYFAQIFSERAKSIEKNINNIQTDCVVDLKKVFAAINNDIQELQKYLSNSTLFLPDYNIKACQNILNELTSRNEEMKQKLLPKKKFGFHNKKVGLKTTQKIGNGDINSSEGIVVDNGIDKVDFSEKSSISTSSFEWTLSNKENEYIQLIGSDIVNRKDLTISNVKNCFIEIQGYAGSLQILNAKNCIILCGPISRSVFAENCCDCQLIAACQQLRLHSSSNVKLFIHVTCRAIIEDCTKIEVSNYNYKYPGIDIDFEKSGLDINVNNYKDIADFNWLSPDKPSPNWKLLDADSGDGDCKFKNWDNFRENFKRNHQYQMESNVKTN